MTLAPSSFTNKTAIHHAIGKGMNIRRASGSSCREAYGRQCSNGIVFMMLHPCQLTLCQMRMSITGAQWIQFNSHPVSLAVTLYASSCNSVGSSSLCDHGHNICRCQSQRLGIGSSEVLSIAFRPSRYGSTRLSNQSCRYESRIRRPVSAEC